MAARRRRPPPWPWIAIGFLAGAVAVLLFLVREPGETLTGENLEAARARWHAAAVSDYRLEIRTSGATQARHRIRVADGEVVQMTTGEAEASHGAWAHWSVEGLFAFLETELVNARDPKRTYGVEPGQVVLRVRFHRELGYPEFFLRHVLGRQQGIEWRVRLERR